jgi:chaperonin GroES
MLKPLHNRLVVERLESEQTTASGIIIPDTAKEKPQQGRVVSVGPGARDKAGKTVPMEIAAGDTVLFTKYGGTEVTLEGKEYLILKEDDVLGVISGKAEAGKAAAGKTGPAKKSAKK